MSADRELLLALGARRLASYLGFAAVAAALSQLVLGASLVVVMCALLAAIAGLLGFVALGAYNVGAWIALFYALGNVLIALYAKTLLAQPVDSHLYAPVDSFLALAVTSGSLLVALLLVRHLSVGRPLFDGQRNWHFLSFLSWTCFVLGGFFWLLNRWFLDPGGSGFGGVALFRDLLFMAVIARTAMLLECSGDRWSFDGRLGVIMAVAAFLGLIDNSKTVAALPIVSHFVTVLFYRRGLPVKSLTILATGILIFVAFVAPMIHALRALGQQELSLGDRVEFVTSAATKLLGEPEQIQEVWDVAAAVFQGSYYNYFGDSGAGQMLLGRYAAVQQIDPVIAEAKQHGPRGGAAVWPAVTRLAPSFIYPDKPEHNEAYNTLVYYRLVDPDGGKFPTLPLAGQAYAGYGFLGLLTIPFVTFFFFLLVVKKLGWRLYRNVYAIFFFCDFVIVYVSQGGFGQYAGAALRNFPLFAVVFCLITHMYRIKLRRGRGGLIVPRNAARPR